MWGEGLRAWGRFVENHWCLKWVSALPHPGFWALLTGVSVGKGEARAVSTPLPSHVDFASFPSQQKNGYKLPST